MLKGKDERRSWIADSILVSGNSSSILTGPSLQAAKNSVLQNTVIVRGSDKDSVTTRLARVKYVDRVGSFLKTVRETTTWTKDNLTDNMRSTLGGTPHPVTTSTIMHWETTDLGREFHNVRITVSGAVATSAVSGYSGVYNWYILYDNGASIVASDVFQWRYIEPASGTQLPVDITLEYQVPIPSIDTFVGVHCEYAGAWSRTFSGNGDFRVTVSLDYDDVRNAGVITGKDLIVEEYVGEAKKGDVSNASDLNNIITGKKELTQYALEVVNDSEDDVIVTNYTYYMGDHLVKER
jgi:hypothetical protein